MEQYLSVDIREYIDREIKHLEEKYLIINKKNSIALDKAEKGMERRLEGMNEFREQLEKQTRSFVTRGEYDINKKYIEQKVSTNSKLIYIGVGIVFVLEILFRFIVKV